MFLRHHDGDGWQTVCYAVPPHRSAHRGFGMTKVLITGGSGFIGRNLVEYLGDRYRHFRAGLRRTESAR